MSPKFIKAVRDLQADKTRTALVFFALFLGLWSFGNVFLTNYILSRDLNQNFLKTEPAHAILISDQFAAIGIETLALMPSVSKYEFRDFSRHRMEVWLDDWIPMWLFGVRDFERQSIARIAAQSGLSTPTPGSLLVERNVLLISNLQVGQSSRIRIGSVESSIEVTGVVFDPGQAPATQDHFVYAYTDQQTYADLTGLEINRRLLVQFEDGNSQQQIDQYTNQLVEWLAQNRVQVSSFKVPQLNQHPHQWQLDTLLFLVGSIGLLAFLMSSVIVTQLMSSVMAKEIRQIGVLRAIGATSSQVVRLYAIYVCLITVAAMLVAFPLAWLTSYTFSYFVAGILNFEILTTTLPLWVFATWVAGSLLIPMVFSMPIIIKGVQIPVLNALNSHGLSTLTGTSKVVGQPTDSTVTMTQRLSGRSAITFTYALRNTLRNKRMLMGTLLTMALGIGIFGTGFNIRHSLSVFLANIDTSMKHDLQIVLNKPVAVREIEKILSSVQGVDKAEFWNGGTGMLQTRIFGTSDGIGLISLPVDTSMYSPVFASGTWISRGNVGDSNIPEVVINQQASGRLQDPELGSMFPITFNGKSYDVKLVGKIKEFDKAKMYISENWVTGTAGLANKYNTLLIKLTDDSHEAVLSAKREIENAVSTSALDVAYVMAQAERVKIIYDHLNIILYTILVLAFIVLLVSALGMTSAMAIDIINRTREIGVLRAVGATPGQVIRLFEIEGLIVVLLSICLGLLISYPLSQVAAVFFGHLMLGEEAEFELVLSSAGILITIAVAVIFGWLASRKTAQLALTISTREALAYE
ncbi:MAG: ABC transporter permease [Proteobacteria bacterium]|nr:ABC transporter permease [Pseudomonadota bacterium]